MNKFKTSLRGFKKADVNNFIIEMDRDFNKAKKELENKIYTLESEKQKIYEDLVREKEISAKLSTLEDHNKQLLTQINDLTRRISEYESQNCELNQKCDDYSNVIREKNEAIENLKKEIGDSIAKLAVSENERNTLTAEKSHLEWKLQEMEESIEDKVAVIVRERDRQAADSFGNKTKKAENDLENATAVTVKKINSTFFEGAESYLRDFKNYADKLLFNSKAMISEMAKEYTEMAEKATYYCDSLEQSAKKSIDDFKSKTASLRSELKGNN